MKSFTYTIVDPVGIHARPAGLLVKTAKAFSGTEISVTKGDKTVKSTQLMKLMGAIFESAEKNQVVYF